jgi:hypothetical protein
MSFCITNISVVSVVTDSPGATCLTASSNNIAIVRGTTFKMFFDLLYSDGPANLYGYFIDMSIRSSSDSSSDLLFCSVQNRMINVNYSTSRVTVQIPVKHTNRLPLGNQYYFVRLINSSGDTQKIIQGIATVSDS